YNCRRYLHDTTSSSPSNTSKNDVTNMDLIEERIKKRAESREERVGNQTLRWNYRSE
uniref:Uncharacterized protein n=1 Tax=Parascaris univalens TaxID=6257 RepID=A0A914ZUE0_PARUN